MTNRKNEVQVYKGIPLEMWKSERLLDRLTDDELSELHALLYSELIDMIEPIVQKSPMIEAILVIDKVMKK
jgi:hypothetical protein